MWWVRYQTQRHKTTTITQYVARTRAMLVKITGTSPNYHLKMPFLFGLLALYVLNGQTSRVSACCHTACIHRPGVPFWSRTPFPWSLAVAEVYARSCDTAVSQHAQIRFCHLELPLAANARIYADWLLLLLSLALMLNQAVTFLTIWSLWYKSCTNNFSVSNQFIMQSSKLTLFCQMNASLLLPSF